MRIRSAGTASLTWGLVVACSDPVRPWPSGDVAWELVQIVHNGVVDPTPQEIVVDPRDGDVVYVASGYGAFRSTNGGAAWTRVYAATTYTGKLALDPGRPDRVFHTSGNTLVVSPDKGASWDTLKVFPGFIRSVEVSSVDAGTIFVGLQSPGNEGIWRSTDDGATWEAHAFPTALSGTSEFIPWDIAEDPLDGTLYVGTEIHDHPQPYRPPAFRSVDRGLTWENVTEALPWHGTRIVVDPVNHEVFFLTEGAGIFRSTNHGQSWSRVGDAWFALELIQDPNDRSRFFGGEVVYSGRNGGVFASEDRAFTFLQHGLQGKTCGSLALSGDSSRLYAACFGAGVYVKRLP